MSYSSSRSTRFQLDSSSSSPKKFISSIKARKAELGLAENGGDVQNSRDDLSSVVNVSSHSVIKEDPSSFSVPAGSSSSTSGLTTSPTSGNMSGEIQSYIQNSSGKNRLPVPKKSFKNVTSPPEKTANSGVVNVSVSASGGVNNNGAAQFVAPKTEPDANNGDVSLSEAASPGGDRESRKEAREAFLRSELGGAGKKLQEPLKDAEHHQISATTHHEKDVINNMQKSTFANHLPGSAAQPPAASSLPVVGNHVQASNKSRLGRDQESYVGFANLPNQVYRKSVKKGFEFTLMLVGESGLGKSTLMNSMFLTDIYNSANPGPSMRSQKTVKVEKMQFVLKEGGVQLKLTVVDTPGFGDSVDNNNCWTPIINYIDEQYNSYLNAESRVIRQVADDTRVHCCLYFISPNGHGLRALDIEVMKQLHEKVNIIPIIAKADSMTLEECKSFKKTILDDINKHGIKIYEFPDCDDEEEQKVVKKMKERIPFAVVGSNTVIESGGRKVRARSYPWGVVEVENLEHNDFVALRNMLIRTHLHDLKDVTNNVHYENFRYDKLLTSVGSEKADKTSLDKSPMLQIEEEKKEHGEKLKKMEAEMHVVFEAKVKEKKNKLMESDLELQRRQEQLRKSLDQQEAEYDNLKITFKSEKETWEDQIKQYEAEQTSTLRKKKTLFS